MIKAQKVKTFAERLVVARQQMGVRLGRDVLQKEIAEEMSVGESAYSQWENGVREPRKLETYEKLAAILGVDPGWLAFGTQEAGHAGYLPNDGGHARKAGNG